MHPALSVIWLPATEKRCLGIKKPGVRHIKLRYNIKYFYAESEKEENFYIYPSFHFKKRQKKYGELKVNSKEIEQ
jgi:hypothetical protein